MGDIVVIGVSCRLPGAADNVENLWKVLVEGQNCWSEVPPDRFNHHGFHNPNPDNHGTHNHSGGHFLKQDVAAFDAAFFGISAHEAKAMDPQQRLLLETTYEAIESAGVLLDMIEESQTGVYVAAFTKDYDRNAFKDPVALPKYHLTGCGDAILSNRISHCFNLSGPSITLDTGCSGSLAALHLACQSLAIGESSMAIAAGVNLILSPDHMLAMSDLHMLNAQGRCFSFDKRGSGYGRGEGCVVMLLTTLENAVRSNLPVRAVVKATRVNQDGRTLGITSPSASAQEKLLKSIYRDIHHPSIDLDFVEAHGTGTTAGDSAEINAISNVLARDRLGPLMVGSVKSNIGHLEAASGLAGVLKAILMLEKGKIVPNADFVGAKPNLDLEKRKIQVSQNLQDLDSEKACLSIAVNSFGYGGTNAHALIQSVSRLHLYPPGKKFNGGGDSGTSVVSKPLRQDVGHPRVFSVSARSKLSLLSTISHLHEWLASNDTEECFRDLAWTLAKHRPQFDWRFSMVASSVAEALQKLKTGEALQTTQTKSSNPTIVFAFAGQGSQWPQMCQDLITTSISFKQSMSEAQDMLHEIGAPWSLVEELMRPGSSSRIDISEVSQPAIIAMQIALVDLLDSMGVRPRIVMGHSSGEIAAAYAARRITKFSALKIAYCRGVVSGIVRQRSATKMGMLAVGLGSKSIRHYLDEQKDLYVACENSPDDTTVSGSIEELSRLKARLSAKGIVSRVLNVDIAYHSPFMKIASEYYLSLLRDVCGKDTDSDVTFISSVTISEKNDIFDGQYWVRNLESKVRYHEAVSCMLNAHQKRSVGDLIIIEIGPHKVLQGLTARCLRKKNSNTDFACFSTLEKNKNSLRTFLELTSELVSRGITVDLNQGPGLTSGEPYRVLTTLPPYSWDHTYTYWSESRLSRDYRFRATPPHDLIGCRLLGSTSLEPIWRHTVSLDRQPYLADHVVNGLVVFPASGYICMAIESFRETYRSELMDAPYTLILDSVEFTKALILSKSSGNFEMQVSLTVPSGEPPRLTRFHEFRIVSLATDYQWQRHCHGRIRADKSAKVFDSSASDFEKSFGLSGTDASPICVRDIKESRANTDNLEAKEIYDRLGACGNKYGPLFACTTHVQILEHSKARSKVRIPDVVSIMPNHSMSTHVIHPTTLDAIFHASLILYHQCQSTETIVPTHIGEMVIRVDMPVEPNCEISARSRLVSGRPQTAEVHIAAAMTDDVSQSSLCLTVQSMRLRGLGTRLGAINSDRQVCCKVEWLEDVDFLTADSKSMIGGEVQLLPEAEIAYLNEQAKLYIREAIYELEMSAHESVAGHLQHFWKWLSIQKESFEEMETDSIVPSDGEVLEKFNTEGLMLERIGKALSSCVLGRVQTLDLMIQDDLLYKLYQDESSQLCYKHAAMYLRYLSFQKPHLRILEVGCGTAAASKIILETLFETSPNAIASYTLTDTSSSFLEPARNKLRAWSDYTYYTTLDIGADPLLQGFKMGSFDVIVASNVIHVTPSIADTLRNLRKLLSSKGKLIIIEVTEMQQYLGVIFGTLPGWWNGATDGRTGGPLLSKDQWAERVRECGFGDLTLWKHDYNGENHLTSMMVAEVVVPHVPLEHVQVVESGTLNLAADLRGLMLEAGTQISLLPLSSLGAAGAPTVILIDAETVPILAKLTEDSFQILKALIRTAECLVWLRIDQEACRGPGAELSTGFLRSVQAENEHLKVIKIDASMRDNYDKAELMSIITRIVARTRTQISKDPTSIERDVLLMGGTVYIPRIVRCSEANQFINTSLSKWNMTTVPLESATKALGIPQNLENSVLPFLLQTDLTNKPLGSEDIEVEIKAFSLHGCRGRNLSNQTQGTTTLLGFSGIITSIGKLVRSYRTGDRVFGWAEGPCSTIVRTGEHHICNLPDSVSDKLGSRLPINFITAHLCLRSIARLSAGACFILHPANSELGLAFITLAQILSIEVLCFVESAQARDTLYKQCTSPLLRVLVINSDEARHCIDSLAASAQTYAAIDCSTTYRPQLDLSCIAPGGTFIQIASSHSEYQFQPSSLTARKDIANVIVNLVDLQKSRGALVQQTFRDVTSIVFEDLSALSWLRDLLETDQPYDAPPNDGSIPESIVGEITDRRDARIALPNVRDRTTLDPSGTYLVIGGMGDLGQQACRFLVACGACNVVAVGRSGAKPHEVLELSQNLQSLRHGVRFHYASFDVSDMNEVERLAQSLTEEKRQPVRGIIHSAVSLNDRSFENMSFSDFKIPTRAKIDGCRNLDAVFTSTQLDFFIVLSSVSGVLGNRGQSNYAAASTFMDAFANLHPISRTHYMSIDLGMVDETRVIGRAKKGGLRRQGARVVRMEEFLAALEFSVSHQARSMGLHQLIVGLEVPFDLTADTPKNSAICYPLFSHVRTSQQKVIIDRPNADSPRSFANMIANTTDQTTSTKIVEQTLITKISEIIQVANRKIDRTSEILNLGLDSLMTIELRNWIQKEFSSALSNDEILNREDIGTLAGKILAKSKLNREQTNGRFLDDHSDTFSGNTAVRDAEFSPTLLGEHTTCPLPKLPVPDLTDSLNQALEARRPFMSDAEYGRFRGVCESFAKPEGHGTRLQEELLRTAQDPKTENRHFDRYADKIYLQRRDPIHPNTTFWGTQKVVHQIQHTQARRAAVVTAAAIEFSRWIKSSTFEPDRLGPEPLCLGMYTWLFNSCREPRQGLDRMVRYPGNNHVVVLRRGHIFRMDWSLESTFDALVLEIEAGFEEILWSSESSVTPVACLTAGQRDEWAQTRQELQSVKTNANVLEQIETALFVVCLDDGAPSSPSERCNQFYLYHPDNRWSDKNLQFVVAENGVSAFVCEHSALDGLSLRKLNQAVTAAVLQDDQDGSRTDNGAEKSVEKKPLIRELTFEISQEIVPKIKTIRDRAQELSPVELERFDLANYGSSLFRKQHISPRAGFQTIIQLANRLFYGHQPETWETVSTARFHNGRVDWIQTASSAMVTFCSTLLTDRQVRPPHNIRQLLSEAVTTYTDQTSRISHGHGFKAHLHTLWALAESQHDTTPLPDFFQDPQWTALSVSSVKTVKTDCLDDMAISETCFFMPEPRCMYVHYEISEDSVHFFVQTWPGKARTYCEMLEKATDMVAEILGGHSG